MQSSTELKQALFIDRDASFFRLRGGYPIPLAGATWWATLGMAGYLLPSRGQWILFAFVTSGAIFPLALLFARLFKVDFMRDKTAAGDILFPTFASMLLFWPIAISAFWNLPSTCSARTGYRYVGPLAGHRVDVWAHRDLYDARSGPRHHLLHPLELVALLALHHSSVCGLCHLSNHRRRNSHRFVSRKGEVKA
jgi:hypothetical protein